MAPKRSHTPQPRPAVRHELAWDALNADIITCTRCPRLIRHCRAVAKEKRKAFLDWNYWGKPVPNFGAADARLLIIGLAPAAHGANRTGRMFTGDRSGDWLYRAMYRAGFATQPSSERDEDGLELIDAAITAVAHCAPPENKPDAKELAHCQPFLAQVLDIVPARVIVALGGIAWTRTLAELKRRGDWVGRALPRFAHAAQVELENGRLLIGSYHPSQQNTFTGRLTEPMLDQIFSAARDWVTNPPKR